MAVRQIPPNTRSITGFLPSTTQPDTAAFESTLERDFYTLLEFDLNVDRREVQPVRIEYRDEDGIRRTYVPDVLVIYRQDIVPARELAPILCEVKYRADLVSNWRTLRRKLRAGRQYAVERGWEFRLMTERQIRTPYLRNAQFLLPFRHRARNYQNETILAAAMQQLREADPESLLLSITTDPMERAELLPSLWLMIGYRLLWTDLSLPLTMSSRIWSMDAHAWR